MTVKLSNKAKAAAIRGHANLKRGMRIVHVHDSGRHTGFIHPWELLSDPKERGGVWQIRRRILTDSTGWPLASRGCKWSVLSLMGVERPYDPQNYIFDPKTFNELIGSQDIVVTPSSYSEELTERCLEAVRNIEQL